MVSQLCIPTQERGNDRPQKRWNEEKINISYSSDEVLQPKAISTTPDFIGLSS